MLFPQHAVAHGYVSDPPSRAILCREGANINCGEINYEPQSVEGPDGFPGDPNRPRDGFLANADEPQGRFIELNEQTVDRWKLTDIKPGKHIIKWVFTASHPAATFKYYMTKQGWNPNMLLSRAQFEATPFCTIEAGGQAASKFPEQECTIPSNYSGHHVIYALWDVSDTAKTFVSTMDVNIVNDGVEPPPLPQWTDVGDIMPTEDLKVGDQVFTHVFNSSNEIPGLKVGITIKSKEEGNKKQWPLLMAKEINRMQGDKLRAGMMRENGEIVVSAGKNDIFVPKGSEIVRTEIEIKKQTDPGPTEDLEVTNDAEFPIKDNGAADVKFTVKTEPARNTNVDLKIYDKNQKLVAYVTSIPIHTQHTINHTILNAEAGLHTAVFLEVSKKGTFVQKTTTFKLTGEGGGDIPDWKPGTVYQEKTKVMHKGEKYVARWYTINQEPGDKRFTGPEGSGKVWNGKILSTK